jgi:hypothetical protein
MLVFMTDAMDRPVTPPDRRPAIFNPQLVVVGVAAMVIVKVS